MKKSYLLFLLIISVFMMSCGGHFFNPRYYYNQTGSSSENEQDPPSGEVDVGGSEDVPEDEDPFKVGEWNDINYRFDGNKILDFLFGASFDGNNVPVYTFFKDGTQWAVSDALTAEKKYNAKDGANKAQGYEISKATFYRYDYKNPLIDPEGSYNQSERMGRFLFYRLQGEAVIVPLNNYLIAVDVYSKLVFAYGKITKTAEKLGQAYPTAFEAVELHGDKRPFYEYDPIGFMAYDETKDALTLTLYREYQEEMAKDANAFFPQVHDSTRDIAGYKDKESAGRSPYYYVSVDDINPETIIDQFKGKTYGIRSGLTLYTYKFSEDGKQVTITLDHFYDGKTSEKTYDYVEVTGATSLKYGDITITGLESYAKVRDSIYNVAAELDYVDPGPEFIYRVRGKVYDAEDGSYSYKFNIDGTILEYYKNGKLDKRYIFNNQDASDRAVYKVDNGGLFSYWGLRLDEHEGVKDGVLYWSVGAGSSPDGTKTEGVTSTPGYLNVDESVIDFFVDEVANKVYAFRDYKGTPGDGRSLKTFKYQFSSDGKTITYIESIPKQEDTSVTYTLVEDKGKTAIYSLDGQQYTFTLQSGGIHLMKNDEAAGELNFQDRGAYFLDIVSGTTYYAPDGSYKYIFDSSGKNLTYVYPSGEEITYTITDNVGSSGSDYTKAVYIENGALIFKYWALRINKTGTMVQMSTGALATAGDILNSAAYGYEAYLTEQGGVSVDRFMASVAGQTYKMRNQDNSYLMQYYTFSSAGNYIIHVVTNTKTDKQTSSNMYYNYQAVDKAVKGMYEEQIPTKQNKTFELKNSNNELYLEGTLVGYLNYEDPGISFTDRVAGKTYKDKYGSYEYRFDASGEKLDYYSGGNYVRTYTFAQQDASDRAVYKQGFATFWGLRLAPDPDTGAEDGVLYWSGSSWASPETTVTDGVTSTPGYLDTEIIIANFIDNLKSKTYKFRDTSEYINTGTSALPDNYTKPTGKSLILYSYAFDSAANKLTYTAATWNGSTETIVYTLRAQTETDATYASDDGKLTIKVTIQGNADILYKMEDTVLTKLGETSFDDTPGPIFTDRVRGATFINEGEQSLPLFAKAKNVKYVFSQDGTQFTLTYEYIPLIGSSTSKTYIYTLARYDDVESNNYTAVYECNEPGDLGAYARVSLVDNEYCNTIKSSETLGQLGGTQNILNYEAYRQK